MGSIWAREPQARNSKAGGEVDDPQRRQRALKLDSRRKRNRKEEVEYVQRLVRNTDSGYTYTQYPVWFHSIYIVDTNLKAIEIISRGAFLPMAHITTWLQNIRGLDIDRVTAKLRLG